MKKITVEQYKTLKAQGLTDAEVLEAYGYSRHSKAMFNIWKGKHNLLHVSQTSFLDANEIKEMAQNMTYRAVAKEIGLDWSVFHRWLTIQRARGNFI